MLGGVSAEVFGDFHGEDGESLAWQEGNHGHGWFLALASVGLESNGEVCEKCRVSSEVSGRFCFDHAQKTDRVLKGIGEKAAVKPRDRPN